MPLIGKFNSLVLEFGLACDPLVTNRMWQKWGCFWGYVIKGNGTSAWLTRTLTLEPWAVIKNVLLHWSYFVLRKPRFALTERPHEDAQREVINKLSQLQKSSNLCHKCLLSINRSNLTSLIKIWLIKNIIHLLMKPQKIQIHKLNISS